MQAVSLRGAALGLPTRFPNSLTLPQTNGALFAARSRHVSKDPRHILNSLEALSVCATKGSNPPREGHEGQEDPVGPTNTKRGPVHTLFDVAVGQWPVRNVAPARLERKPPLLPGGRVALNLRCGEARHAVIWAVIADPRSNLLGAVLCRKAVLLLLQNVSKLICSHNKVTHPSVAIVKSHRAFERHPGCDQGIPPWVG